MNRHSGTMQPLQGAEGSHRRLFWHRVPQEQCGLRQDHGRGQGSEQAADRQHGQTGEWECRLEEDRETMVGPDTIVGQGTLGLRGTTWGSTMVPCLVSRRWRLFQHYGSIWHWTQMSHNRCLSLSLCWHNGNLSWLQLQSRLQQDRDQRALWQWPQLTKTCT